MRCHELFARPWMTALAAAMVAAGCGGGTEETKAPAVCGDGVVNAGEACDDGNQSDTDACLTTCRWASCGDGFVRDGVEACDGPPRACTTSCSSPGSQACVSCTWAATCTPPGEACNGTDDDCDGLVDEDLGSSDVARTGTPTWLGLGGSSDPGFLSYDTCLAGEVVVGFDGEFTVSGHIGSIAAHCGKPMVACTGGAWTATLAAGTTLARRGSGTGGGAYSALCPADGVVVGFRSWFLQTEIVMGGLVFRCAPLVVTPSGTDWTIGAGPSAEIAAVGGTTTGQQFMRSCAAGEVAMGIATRSDSALYGFGIYCQPLARASP